MKRWLGSIVCSSALFAPLVPVAADSLPGGGAPFLQFGVDAARTGDLGGNGPLTDDVAFVAHLNGSRDLFARPLIFGGKAYVATRTNPDNASLAVTGIYRVDLATAAVDLLVERPATLRVYGPFQTLASDSERLFLSDNESLAAYDLDGQQLWSSPHPSLPHDPLYDFYVDEAGWFCSDPALRNGTLYLACTASLAEEGNLFVRAYDAASGRVQWIWWRSPVEPRAVSQQLPNLAGDPVAGTATTQVYNNALAIVGDYALVAYLVRLTDSGVYRVNVTAVGLINQAYEWGRTGGGNLGETRVPVASGDGAIFHVSFPPAPVGRGNLAFVKFEELHALDLDNNGAVVWRQAMRDHEANYDLGSALALADGHVYATSRHTLFRFRVDDRSDRASEWLGPGDYWDTSELIVAGPLVYARSANGQPGLEARTTLRAFDRLTLEPRWTYELPAREAPPYITNPWVFSIGEGVLVAAGDDGTVVVMGNTPASPQPVVQPSTAYPAAGAPVTVDLSRTAAGVGGPATSFRAEWGDGNETDWQASPRLSHAYAVNGDYVATFQVRNAAGQSARVTQSFYVGGRDPDDLNVIQLAFAPQNQELTFFVMGLLVSGVGASYGYARLRRHRTILQRELAAVRETYEGAGGDVGEREAGLAERRLHADELLRRGRIDESQYAVLKGRVEELASGLRSSAMEERLDFLPLGIVKELRAALRDGRIERLERHHVLDAIARSQQLTPAQKRKARAQVDEWFRRDTGA